MRLDIAKHVTLATPLEAVWAVIREPMTVAACLPNAQDFAPTGEPGRYTTTLVERIGPFTVRVALGVEVTEEAAEHRMVARIAGEDRGGQARVRGEVRAAVSAAAEGSVLEVTSDVEVLGRLASLGAVPIRRRGDQVFDGFVRALGARLEAPNG